MKLRKRSSLMPSGMRARKRKSLAAHLWLMKRKNEKCHGIAQPFGQNVGEKSMSP